MTQAHGVHSIHLHPLGPAPWTWEQGKPDHADADCCAQRNKVLCRGPRSPMTWHLWNRLACYPVSRVKSNPRSVNTLFQIMIVSTLLQRWVKRRQLDSKVLPMTIEFSIVYLKSDLNLFWKTYCPPWALLCPVLSVHKDSICDPAMHPHCLTGDLAYLLLLPTLSEALWLCWRQLVLWFESW